MSDTSKTTLDNERVELLQQLDSPSEALKGTTDELRQPDHTSKTEGPTSNSKSEPPTLQGPEIHKRLEKAAKLTLVEYELERLAIMRESGMRGHAVDSIVKQLRKKETIAQGISFEDVTPWETEVQLNELLYEIQAAIRKFIVCDADTSVAAALWIILTWIIDKVHVAPLAVITAPEKGCGKSQLLNIMAKMVYRPLSASSISPAALYRVIEAHQPTLMIDETDTFMKENEDLRGIINSGHTRDSAYVIRTVGDEHTPTRFSTWGAKALSGIGKLPDTIMDRAIILRMRKRLPHETVQRMRHAEIGFFEEITSKIQRCISDFGIKIAICRPELPESLSDRSQDNWEPLLAIADIAGGEWPRLARAAAIKLSVTTDSGSIGNELIRDIHEIFEAKNLIRIPTSDLITKLCEDDELPWAAYNRGKPITPHQLGKRLSEYGISSKTIRVGAITKKGFEATQFTDAFQRYVTQAESPLEISVTGSQHTPDVDPGVPFDKSHHSQTTQAETLESIAYAECDRVTDPWDQ